MDWWFVELDSGVLPIGERVEALNSALVFPLDSHMCIVLLDLVGEPTRLDVHRIALSEWQLGSLSAALCTR